MKRWTRWTAALGAGAVLFGIGIATPARAADWWGDHRRDVRQLRRDEDRLADLQRRRDVAERHHDWRAVRRLDHDIANVRRDIERERREMRDEYHRGRRWR